MVTAIAIVKTSRQITMSTVILALDMATRAGWCAGSVGKTPVFGTADFSGKLGIGEAMAKARYWLSEEASLRLPTLVVYEAPYIPVPRKPRLVRAGTEVVGGGAGPPPMNPLTLRKLIGFADLVEEIAHERGIECREYTSGQFTKWWTGKGAWGGREAKKAAVMRLCRLHGYPVADDNQADAVALWHWAERVEAPEIAARRAASWGSELPLHGTLTAPVQQRIGRRISS